MLWTQLQRLSSSNRICSRSNQNAYCAILFWKQWTMQLLWPLGDYSFVHQGIHVSDFRVHILMLGQRFPLFGCTSLQLLVITVNIVSCKKHFADCIRSKAKIEVNMLKLWLPYVYTKCEQPTLNAFRLATWTTTPFQHACAVCCYIDLQVAKC